jgi:hypothetical protein
MPHAPDSPSISTPPSQSSANPPLSLTITEAVIAQIDLTRDELPPLYDVIDPDALENLFSPRTSGAARTDWSVVFQYAGCNITVRADRTVTAEPSPDR